MAKRLLCVVALCWVVVMGAVAQQQLTNLPTIYINTNNGAGIYDKVNYVYSTMTYVDADSVAVYDSVRVRGRGNSTWGMQKKPYRIKFHEKEKFLGKGYANAKDWTFLANHGDKTLIRNAVASEMGVFMGMDFNPAAKFVDLYLNNVYQGNYQISDQVQVRAHRVNVTEQDVPLTPTSDITGGYLLEIDGFATSEPNYFRTDKKLLVTVKYPDEDDVEPRQNAYIKDYIQQLENAIFSANFKDPLLGYRAYVDPISLINWYIATEYTGNVDGFWSTYIYKEQGDPKIYFGPMWDHDIAFNNCNRVGDVTNRLMMDAGFGTDLTKVWMKRIWEDPWFARMVNSRWKQLVAAGIKEHLLAYTDSMSQVVYQSQIKNFQPRTQGGAGWVINKREYNEITLYSSYQAGVDYLKTFISAHADYLTTTFAARAPEEGGGEVPEPEDPREAFVPDETFYYRIMNKGANKLFDVATMPKDTTLVGMWDPTQGRAQQHWAIDSVAGSNGKYVRILNAHGGLALTDMAVYNSSEGKYSIDMQVKLTPLDSLNERQMWHFAPLRAGQGLYAFINKQTNLALNNSGGGQADGNRVISYTNDDRNEESQNRQWYFEKTEMRPEPQDDDYPDALPQVLGAPQYAVIYNPDAQTIRFVAEATHVDAVQDLPQMTVHILNTAGMQLRTFSSEREEYVGDLATGIYMITWHDGQGMRSVKFVKE